MECLYVMDNKIMILSQYKNWSGDVEHIKINFVGEIP